MISASRRALFTLGLALCAAAGVALAQAASEAAVKAAFLYKFAGYVEWPPGSFARPDQPFVIGVSGAEEVAEELERLVPRRAIHNRRIEVRRMVNGTSAADVHLLFVGRGHSNARSLVRVARENGVLTVTEGPHGLELGSAINFVTQGDRVAFEVSLDSAERSGLRISSRMLAVARRVVPRS